MGGSDEATPAEFGCSDTTMDVELVEAVPCVGADVAVQELRQRRPGEGG